MYAHYIYNRAIIIRKLVHVNSVSTILQALQYLRKVCNHPGLVLTPNHPQYDTVSGKLRDQGTSLHDINHAPKLTALK